MERLTEFSRECDPTLLWFWSYQCDRGESPSRGLAPIVFRDRYKPLEGDLPGPHDCPLNWMEDIAGACERCRMCFNGTAVNRGRELAASRARTEP